MRYEDFERRAWEEWERIPAEYKAGVDGLIVERRALAHPSLPDVYTLGECATESWPSDFGGPDTVRSAVVLYYGSFFRLSRLDPEFDWEHELWETLTHELQHHLESLAADDSLIDVDYAADQHFRRLEGEPFDPLYFRSGPQEDGWYRVEEEFFREVAAPDAAQPLHFDWRGATYRVTLPHHGANADMTLITIAHGLPADTPPLNLVLVRRRGLGEALRALLRGRPPRVQELEAEAVRVEPGEVA